MERFCDYSNEEEKRRIICRWVDTKYEYNKILLYNTFIDKCESKIFRIINSQDYQ